MSWKKLNEYVKIWEKPILGSENQKDGKRYMALCIDPSSKNPYQGIVREVIERKGSPDIQGFLDKSKLILVESEDLLNWSIVEDLEIKGVKKIINKILNNTDNKKEFIGLEDPDILVDDSGNKHVYFTIAFKYKNKKGYETYLGHAFNNSLKQLKITNPVLGKINNEITGFKEICPVPTKNNKDKIILTEVLINKNNKTRHSAIGLSITKNLSSNWEYKGLVHNPQKEHNAWCSGHSSPCRFFDPSIINYNGQLIGIMNGREPNTKLDKQVNYGKFRPGLFLFNQDSEKIIWVDKEPLFKDPLATTITFASELISLNNKEAILYAHVNDSFMRAYKLNIKNIKQRITNNFKSP